jgi:hypothetical protein
MLPLYPEKGLGHRVLKAVGGEKWRNCRRKSVGKMAIHLQYLECA